MRYISTRGAAPSLPFDEVLLAGLAADGGLYIPESWPRFSAAEMRRMVGLSYADLAIRVMTPFLGGTIPGAAFERMVREAYAAFDHPAVVPLKQLGERLWVMELFHGPTLAFKDLALQLLGPLYDHVLGAKNRRITIVGATSGDTGSAAIEACRDRARIEIFILHPEGRVSPVQRRQMTTVMAKNVHNLAIQGSFDDCQDLVKAMFNDRPFREASKLGAVNSINWARIMAQIVYYFRAALALGAPDRPVRFAVPTGNFGNVYAGYVARQMGLPIERFIVGSNRNDILTRLFATGVMEIRAVEPSLSPSMDIQVSSNLERLLFDLYDRDGKALAQDMEAFRKGGRLALTEARHRAALAWFEGFRLSDDETLAEIGRLHRATGELIDPHSAIGIAAAASAAETGDTPVVALATAHPAKFAEAVERATGEKPRLPARLADLMTRPERMDRLPNELAAVEAHIRNVLA
ncbi:MAG: threonine synthase [Pseudomonadota bacterium]